MVSLVTHTSRIAWLCACFGLASHTLAASPHHLEDQTAHETSVGGSERFLLPDGASAQLNTNTRLVTSCIGSSCVNTLTRGEVFFHASRGTLQVQAGDLSVRASQAEFSLRCYGSGQIEIMVLNGVVIVSRPIAERSRRMPFAHSSTRIVSAGHSVTLHSDTTEMVNLGRPEVERRLAWREQRLELANETIAEAVAEFNRYGRTQLSVEDDAIGQIRVGGAFLLTDPEAFAASAGRLFGLRVETQQTSFGALIRLGPVSSAARANPAQSVRMNAPPATLSRAGYENSPKETAR